MEELIEQCKIKWNDCYSIKIYLDQTILILDTTAQVIIKIKDFEELRNHLNE